MPKNSPVNSKSYYDSLPTAEHQCGDIWANLPSMGLLSAHPHVTGIMITPACDVSQFKTETLTYLPIISVRDYFGTIGALAIIRQELTERYKSAELEFNVEWATKGYEPPREETLASEIERLTLLASSQNLAAKKKEQVQRALAGLRVSSVCRSSSKKSPDLRDVALLFGTNWTAIKRKIITNSYRSDVHFLPSDRQNSNFTWLSEHSVALFRYPISIPSEILTSSQQISEYIWPEYVKSSTVTYSSAHHFLDARPLKVLSLKSSFRSDLISRFIALYARIGSPDFSGSTIEQFAGEIA
jgi:hypothetical protein